MAVKIRLRRMGAKKRPIYRLVAIDSRRAREGRFIDHLGHYNPLEKPATVKVNEEKIFHWLKQGAEPTDTVRSLFAQIGLSEKWELIKQGKDASDIEIRAFISERRKKRKKTKAAITEEAAETEVVSSGEKEKESKE
ncbi:MAG: 30S ribosomal protein S16 [candidate division Zixibacteria bacterium]|nr:30S ribosomal protein S16 [candidate division Zixibacteria bacterium]